MFRLIKNAGLGAVNVVAGNAGDGNQVKAVLVNALRDRQTVIGARAGYPDLMHTINSARRIKAEKTVYLREQVLKFRQFRQGWFNFSKFPRDIPTEVIDRARLDKVIVR